MKTKPLRIFLADLAHINNHGGDDGGFVMPLSVGLVASYAINKFGSDVEVRLFKYPEKLFQALQEDHCDILGCSSYVWNSNLSHWACRVAKKKNPNVLTCQGGPDFPLFRDQKLSYLKKHNYLDIRVLNEGEIAFSKILQLMLGKEDRNAILFDKIEGCVYLHQGGKTLVEGNASRVDNLDSIPSPYTTGLLDEFFDGKLIPIIQTTKGCPFTCNYCAESNQYYTKVKHFKIQTVIEELNYIGDRIRNTSITLLHIADSNYGMYNKDKVVSETINKLQLKYNWPLIIAVSTGKKFENVFEKIEMLKDTFDFSLSVQSMDNLVLEEIGRKNFLPEKYKEVSNVLAMKHWPTLAETIVLLPNETFESYINGLLELIDWGVNRIVANPLMFINGTIYKKDGYRKKFGYNTKFRILSSRFGTYAGEKIFEYEEIAISSNSLSFDEYLEINKFSLLVELLFNSFILVELEQFVKDYGRKYKDFVLLAFRELPINAHWKVQSIFQSFIDESKNELKDDENSLVDYFSNEVNYRNLIDGEIGINLKYKHKALIFSRVLKEWLEFVLHCLGKFITSEKGVGFNDEIDNLKRFLACKFYGVLDPLKTGYVLKENFSYDIIKWLNQKKDTLPLEEFKAKDLMSYQFYFNHNQSSQRNHLFDANKEKGIIGLTNVLMSIRPQYKLYRKVKPAHPL